MSNSEFGSLTVLLFLLLAAAHVFGHIFSRLRQPKVIGEIFAGVLLGPSILGLISPALSQTLFGERNGAGSQHDAILSFLYSMGLLLLMFVSGAETRHLFSREDRREIAWLTTFGTGLPFLLALVATLFVPLEPLMGSIGNRTSLVLVLGIAVAVTSIPVISRIFYDLQILHTRFARLVLGVAVIEDIILWALLAIATALAASAAIPAWKMAIHVSATLVYFGVGLTIAPPLLRRLNAARWNVLAKASPVGYVVAVLLAYAGVAALFDVSLVFAAFLAGFAMASDGARVSEALDALSKFSFAVFIPIYFAVVGYRLELGRTFSFTMLAVFLVTTCVAKLLSVGLGARLAGFSGLAVINLAIATNARGGPGIVLASVAYDAGIINASFYTTLVLVAVLTSQAAGAWLGYVLQKGWPLLTPQPVEVPAPAIGEEKIAA
jgi:Kef-type K+ transport system membrane component KefB